MSKKRWILLILCLLVAGCAIFYIVFSVTRNQRGEDAYDELRNLTTPTTEATTPTPSVTFQPVLPSQPTEPTKPPFVSPKDFQSLQERNPDIYAWLEVTDTTVDYPVLQHEYLPNYYLNHTVDHVAGETPGAIYSQTGTDQNLGDFVTVLYGHNMGNGTMFGNLHKYHDESYLMDHRQIVMYTPEGTYTYTIIAAVKYGNHLITGSYDFSTEAGRQEFLDSLDDVRYLNNHLLTDTEYGTDDRYLVLSTCISDHNYRYIVVGVLTNEET